MRGCSHPNIVQLHTSFSVKNELWLVLEYMDRGTNQQRFCALLNDKDLRNILLVQDLVDINFER